MVSTASVAASSTASSTSPAPTTLAMKLVAPANMRVLNAVAVTELTTLQGWTRLPHPVHSKYVPWSGRSSGHTRHRPLPTTPTLSAKHAGLWYTTEPSERLERRIPISRRAYEAAASAHIGRKWVPSVSKD